MKPERTCPDCGATLPADAPRGLCPNCLMGAALPSTSPSSHRGDRHLRAGRPRRPRHHRPEHRPRPPRAPARHGARRDPGAGRPTRCNRRRPVDPLPDRRRDRPRRHGRRPQGPRPRPGPRRRHQGPARADLRDNADLVRRFVEEAQIGGQLQHPGVVPVYELGTFADRRPFFTMKLVKGRTLADLLAARPGPADDLPRFLSIFAPICADDGLRPHPRA